MIELFENLLQLSSFFGIKWRSLKKITRQLDKEYKFFYVIQKNGKRRKITSPSLVLSNIQKTINKSILTKHKRKENVFGFYSKTNHIKNAEYHIGSKYMLNLDIKNFFGSINTKQVYFVFNKIYGFNKSVSTMLTKLTTYEGVLPQGAPTSPMLSNLVFRNMDYRINALCEKLQIKYSRYADDLTFSSEIDFNRKYVYSKVNQILQSNYYEINTSKTRMLDYDLSVTGLNIIENKLQIPRRYIKKITQELYYINKFGIESHLEKSFSFKKETETYLQELFGRINYVRQVEQDLGDKLLEMFLEIDFS